MCVIPRPAHLHTAAVPPAGMTHPRRAAALPSSPTRRAASRTSPPSPRSSSTSTRSTPDQRPASYHGPSPVIMIVGVGCGFAGLPPRRSGKGGRPPACHLVGGCSSSHSFLPFSISFLLFFFNTCRYALNASWAGDCRGKQPNKTNNLYHQTQNKHGKSEETQVDGCLALLPVGGVPSASACSLAVAVPAHQCRPEPLPASPPTK